MKNLKVKSKQKHAQKSIQKSKIDPPKQQPLPEFLCQRPPVFCKNQISSSEGYFKQFKYLDEDINKCKQLLVGYNQAEKQTQKKLQELVNFTCNQEISFKSGLPFYSCKNIIFNQYLICLKMYELFRLNNADFTSGPGLRLYQRLVYLKTLILKLGPVEKKLQYQKNKLLKKGEKIKIKQYKQRAGNQDEEQKAESKQISSSQQSQHQNQNIQDSQNEEDNLAYKPMVKSLISNSTQKLNQKQKQGKYVAPKLSAVLPAEQKRKRRQQRQDERRKAHLLRKFRGDIDSGDQAQEKDLFEGIDPRFKKRYEQKLRFEEENFTRINETKKQKYFKKQMMKNRFKNTLNDEIKQIQMIRELVNDEQDKGAKRSAPIGVKPHPQKLHAKKKRKIE